MTFPDLLRSREAQGLRRFAPLCFAGLLLVPLALGLGSGPAARSFLALVGCGALAAAGLRWLSRRQAPPPPDALRIVSRAALSPKSGVALVEADGQRYLVAFGDGFASLLAGTRPHHTSARAREEQP